MLSFCTNIYPVETWDETLAQLRNSLPDLRRELELMRSPLLASPIGIGLRVSAQAAQELSNSPKRIHAFRQWLDDEYAMVQTINGFPYGSFHETRVKERVFQPDWTTGERFEYTRLLINLLATLSPQQSTSLSISTLPGSHQYFHANEERMLARLDALCGIMDHVAQETGKIITLGLEPEPMGYFDDTVSSVHFFQAFLNRSRRPDFVRRHIGITYDTCHFAVMGESPDWTMSFWEQNDLPIFKIQFSNALELRVATPADIDTLIPFIEPVYFHQTCVSFPQTQRPALLFADLPDAIDWGRQHPSLLPHSIWRVHFHIPLYTQPEPPLANTNPWNVRIIDYLSRTPSFRPILEVETYTWNVLPPGIRDDEVTRQIARELNSIATQLPEYCLIP